MEDDKKKKKNKKKNKNKQAKTAEPLSVSDQIPSNGFDQTAAAHTSNYAPKASADLDRHGATARDASTEEQIKDVQMEKEAYIEKEASTEEKIKQLQMEKVAYMNKEIELELKFSNLHNEKDDWLQKEDILEEKIKQLQEEKDEYINKEADLGLIISKLQAEKDSWFHREVGYEQKIKQLVDEASTRSVKEVGLVEKIKQLATERELWAQKEAGYEEKINQLIDEASTTSVKEAGLIEKIKLLEIVIEIWAQKENSTKETIAGLIADKTRLHSQVMELEESRKNLLQENQQLLENISGLQSQIQNTSHLSSETKEMENQHIKSEMFAAQTMVEKLLTENAELVEELKAERDRRGTMAELFLSNGSGPMDSTVEPARGVKHSALISDSTSGTTERLLSTTAAENSALGPDPIVGTAEKFAGEVADAFSEDQFLIEEKMNPVENGEVHLEKDFSNFTNHDNSPIPDMEIIVSEEIEQIPLEENEASGTNLQVEDSSSVETSLVPISDAPLIGAPFRLISFMARYVSGADLVNQIP